MPVEAKPLFRPDVLHPLIAAFHLPASFEQMAAPLRSWAETLASPQAASLTSTTAPAPETCRTCIIPREQLRIEDLNHDQRTLCNNTVYILPAGNVWVMAVLNAPIGWWFAWRKAQHGKDEALRYFTDFVEAFPIPAPIEQQQQAAEATIRQLMALKDQQQQVTHDVLDWLRVEYEIQKPSQKLQAPENLAADDFIAEVRKLRGRSKPLGPAALKGHREGFRQSADPLRSLIAEADVLERQLSDLVNAAYRLTADEVNLIWKTAPPRMLIRFPNSP